MSAKRKNGFFLFHGKKRFGLNLFKVRAGVMFLLDKNQMGVWRKMYFGDSHIYRCQGRRTVLIPALRAEQLNKELSAFS